MAGFFEFSLMRVRDDIDQKALSELYYQYINVEEDFVKALFLDGQTPLGRIFVQESALSETHALHVLDYERASAVIRSAAHIGISLCYCRHKMAHMERDCSSPQKHLHDIQHGRLLPDKARACPACRCAGVHRSAGEGSSPQSGPVR